MTSKVLISFATRPGRGSEGGVGWAFVRGAAEYAHQHNDIIDVVIDARDFDDVAAALVGVPHSDRLRLNPLQIPKWAQKHYGDSRTRESYLAWVPNARRLIRRLDKQHAPDVIHQVTFATATLPSVLPKTSSAKRIWGPLNVPGAVIYSRGEKTSFAREGVLHGARLMGRLHVHRADLVIASTDLAAGHLSSRSRPMIVEPNIFLDNLPKPAGVDQSLISLIGLLTDGKRPWLAIEALARPELSGYRLQIIGDGPLRGQLEHLVASTNLEERVTFLGRLDYADALAALSRSRLLLHPAVREGSTWVIGEAAALGIPSVTFSSVGSATTVRLSDNGGEVVREAECLAQALAEGAHKALSRPAPAPVSRWNAGRASQLLAHWWSTP